MTLKDLTTNLKKGYSMTCDYSIDVSDVCTHSHCYGDCGLESREDDINMYIIFRNAKLNDTFRISVSFIETVSSCGVYQMAGLMLDSDFTQIKKFTKREVNINNFVKDIYSTIIEYVKAKERAAFVIASNNVYGTKINKIFDSLAIVKTDYKKNPNSNNKIKTWIL